MFLKEKDIINMLRRVVFFFLVWKERGANLNTLHYYIESLIDGLMGRLEKRY